MSQRSDINNYNSFYNILVGGFDIERYSKDKKTIADTICRNLIDKMQTAFHWEGLPDTIPQKWMEIMLMCNGYSVITEADGNLYALWGGLGGEDEYYQPTICTIANPWLKYSKTVNIYHDAEGVLISNDTLRQGIVPLIGKYAGLLAENTISIRLADILARTTNIISGADESTIESAKEYFRQLEKGELGIIEESPFLDDLKVQAASTQAHTQITDLIELEQYLKASLYNELGLQANYNMKRESINSDEAQLDNDMIRPYIQNMLEMRQEGAERVNKKYGLNITVELSGVWKEKQEEKKLTLAGMAAEVATDGSEEINGDDPEEINADDPEEINADDPEEVATDDPEEVATDDPEEVAADDPEETDIPDVGAGEPDAGNSEEKEIRIGIEINGNNNTTKIETSGGDNDVNPE